ncbi:MAG: hypothetical protein AAGG55_00435 [Pseudomonadota bacterium]
MLRPLAILPALLFAVSTHADPCSDVAADTVAELRAGAGEWWSEDIEGLVRAAAGSACVKALSGRYGANASMAAEESVAASPASASEAASSPEPEDAAQSEDSDSWSFGGITFKSMSGSPGKKPYERARQNDREEEEGQP